VSSNLGIPSRADNYADWYNELVLKADLADYSAVRGCMVIKPHGYALWENMQRALDDKFKATGHVNAYFPLFIPKSFFEREAEHVEGFAKECAVVTHHRLKANPTGPGLIPDPDAALEEPLIVRPTSETVIWNTYSKWIQSYRDLPILINQWANVVRWEMRTRLFLRTAEFLWQEGHTAHATYDEAEEEALTILECYRSFAEDWMAVPVLVGTKSENEKFAGADHTYCIEALTQDLRAIQAGTSHHLGQNFAKAFDCQFQSAEGKLEYVYATSWGVSTRLIGTLIMAHSDDKGLVCPPKLAPIKAVIVPVGNLRDQMQDFVVFAKRLQELLSGPQFEVKIDLRIRQSLGFKANDWDLKGVPLRIEVGGRELEEGSVKLAFRDGTKEELVEVRKLVRLILQEQRVQESLSADAKKELNSEVRRFKALLGRRLDRMQNSLYRKALAHREANTHRVDTWEQFEAAFAGEGGGGFVVAHWDGTPETEELIAQKTKATIRCIPLKALHPDDDKPGACILTGKPSAKRVVFAKAY